MPSYADLTATVRDSSGNVLLLAPVTFSSADPGIASVTALTPYKCRVTAVSRGVTRVVATNGSVTSNVCIVYVDTTPSTTPLPAVRVWVVRPVGVIAPGPASSVTPAPAVSTRVVPTPTVT